MDYDTLKANIDHAPLTWLPALLIAVVQACVRGGVFAPGGLEKVVKSAMEKA